MKLRSLSRFLIAFAFLLLGCSRGNSGILSQTFQSRAKAANFPAVGLYDNASESPLIQLIDSAQEAIDIEIYEMREPEVHAALVRAVSERKLRVRVVIEPRAVGGCQLSSLFGEKSQEVWATDPSDTVQPAESADESSEICQGYINALRALQDVGIELRPFLKSQCGGDSERCVQHGKMVLADKRMALISTGNFNSSSLCSLSADASRCNRDYSVLISDKPSLEVLAKIFAADFAGRVANIDQIKRAHPGHQLTVSPFAHAEVLRFIRAAKKTIELQAQYLKEPELNRELIAAATRGVRVRATLASACSFARIAERSADKLREIFEPMLDAGIDIRMFTTRNRIAGKPAYLHSKSFVVDGQRAWVGSINGSTQSFVQNREFGVFSDDREFVSKLMTIMDRDHHSPANHSVEENLNCERTMAEEFGSRTDIIDTY